jgi:hypothetical protein
MILETSIGRYTGNTMIKPIFRGVIREKFEGVDIRETKRDDLTSTLKGQYGGCYPQPSLFRSASKYRFFFSYLTHSAGPSL